MYVDKITPNKYKSTCGKCFIEVKKNEGFYSKVYYSFKEKWYRKSPPQPEEYTPVVLCTKCAEGWKV